LTVVFSDATINKSSNGKGGRGCTFSESDQERSWDFIAARSFWSPIVGEVSRISETRAWISSSKGVICVMLRITWRLTNAVQTGEGDAIATAFKAGMRDRKSPEIGGFEFPRSRILWLGPAGFGIRNPEYLSYSSCLLSSYYCLKFILLLSLLLSTCRSCRLSLV